MICMKINLGKNELEIIGHAENNLVCTSISVLFSFLECACEEKGEYKIMSKPGYKKLEWSGDISEYIKTFKNFVSNLNVEVTEHGL